MTRVSWDSTSEGILMKGLQDAREAAQTGDNNFKPQVYHNSSAKLQKAGYSIDHKKVKSRWSRFKASFAIARWLRTEASGFGWDDSKKCVTATAEVWHALLYDEAGNKKKKFSDYNYFKTNSFPHYDTIQELIGDTSAVGDNAFSSTSGPDAAPIPIDPMLSASQDDEEIHPDPQEDAGQSPALAEEEEDDDEGSQEVMSQIPTRSPPTPVTPAPRSKRPATPPPRSSSSKRVKRTSSGHISSLCESVNELVHGLVGEPSTPGLTLSPLRKKAWDTVKAEEGLSPISLGRCRRVFREEVNIKEYLGFDALIEEEHAARSSWLQDEIHFANSCCV